MGLFNSKKVNLVLDPNSASSPTVRDADGIPYGSVTSGMHDVDPEVGAHRGHEIHGIDTPYGTEIVPGSEAQSVDPEYEVPDGYEMTRLGIEKATQDEKKERLRVNNPNASGRWAAMHIVVNVLGTKIIDKQPWRGDIVITNFDVANTLWISPYQMGANSAGNPNSVRIPPGGASRTIRTTQEIWAVASAGTCDIDVQWEFE